MSFNIVHAAMSNGKVEETDVALDMLGTQSWPYNTWELFHVLFPKTGVQILLKICNPAAQFRPFASAWRVEMIENGSLSRKWRINRGKINRTLRLVSGFKTRMAIGCGTDAKTTCASSRWRTWCPHAHMGWKTFCFCFFGRERSDTIMSIAA